MCIVPKFSVYSVHFVIRGGVVTAVEKMCLPIGERSVCSVKFFIKC